MAASPSTPLLSPGHEAEWAAINREEAEQRRAMDMALTPSERVEEGQRLSEQAVSLLAASIRDGHAPARAFWS
jgi:mannose/cellobiose epimerase-like protein (N-acyl-D-glucosamine 2-epimerase family)